MSLNQIKLDSETGKCLEKWQKHFFQLKLNSGSKLFIDFYSVNFLSCIIKAFEWALLFGWEKAGKAMPGLAVFWCWWWCCSAAEEYGADRSEGCWEEQIKVWGSRGVIKQEGVGWNQWKRTDWPGAEGCCWSGDAGPCKNLGLVRPVVFTGSNPDEGDHHWQTAGG